MSARLWYPQLDINETMRRMALILSHCVEPLSNSRLYVLDFYLANPPLLNLVHMNRDVRRAFGELHIDKPGKSFISYPPAKLLFDKMRPMQMTALRTLVGKDIARSETGARVTLTGNGRTVIEGSDAFTYLEGESELVVFLTTSFSSLGEGLAGGLERAANLSRVAA
jgi:hypothetical protein